MCLIIFVYVTIFAWTREQDEKRMHYPRWNHDVTHPLCTLKSQSFLIYRSFECMHCYRRRGWSGEKYNNYKNNHNNITAGSNTNIHSNKYSYNKGRINSHSKHNFGDGTNFFLNEENPDLVCFKQITIILITILILIIIILTISNSNSNCNSETMVTVKQ